MDATVVVEREKKLHTLLWAGVQRVLQNKDQCLVVTEDGKLYLAPSGHKNLDLTDLEMTKHRELDHELLDLQGQCDNWRSGYGNGWPSYVVQTYAWGIANMPLDPDMYDMRPAQTRCQRVLDSHVSDEMEWLAEQYGLNEEDQSVWTRAHTVYRRPAYALSRDLLAITLRPAQLIGSRHLQAIAKPYADYAHGRCQLLLKQKADAIAKLELEKRAIGEKQAELAAGTGHVRLIRSTLQSHLVPDVLKIVLLYVADKTVLVREKQN